MFTVVIAAYNSEKFLEETLHSLQNQTHQDWEAIISVNGSIDKTAEITKSICEKDKRFSFIESSIANKSSALNRAIVRAKREWISILDSDDLWESSKLEDQKRFIESNVEVDVVGTQLQYIDALGKKIDESPSLPCEHEEVKRNFFNNVNAIANSSAVYRKSLHEKLGYYDVEFFGVEDYDWWKRCMRNGAKFHNLKEKHLLHRIHPSSNFNSKNLQNNMKHVVDSLDGFLRNLRER